MTSASYTGNDVSAINDSFDAWGSENSFINIRVSAAAAIGGAYSYKRANHIKFAGVRARDKRIGASTAETSGPGAARRARTAANGRASSTRRSPTTTRRARAASSGAARETGRTAANGRASSARRTTTRRIRAASSGAAREAGRAATNGRASSAHRAAGRRADPGDRDPAPASRSASCSAAGRPLARSTAGVSANHRAITRPRRPRAGSAHSPAPPIAPRPGHRPRATRNATPGAQ
jgi:hypothetical protein